VNVAGAKSPILAQHSVEHRLKPIDQQISDALKSAEGNA
jgi:hypothetical protein